MGKFYLYLKLPKLPFLSFFGQNVFRCDSSFFTENTKKRMIYPLTLFLTE